MIRLAIWQVTPKSQLVQSSHNFPNKLTRILSACYTKHWHLKCIYANLGLFQWTLSFIALIKKICKICINFSWSISLITKKYLWNASTKINPILYSLVATYLVSQCNMKHLMRLLGRTRWLIFYLHFFVVSICLWAWCFQICTEST